MKKVVFWILVSALVMLILPWLAVSFVKGDNGMAVCFILFYLGNPIYSILAGVYAEKDRKELWIVPGSAHAMSYKDYPQEYTEHVKKFVGKYIR